MREGLSYLLDTNILSDLIRNPTGKVTQHIKRVGEACICTSIIVASELRFGAEKKRSTRLTARVNAILSVLEILPYEEPADIQYARIRCQLEKLGAPIGPNDLLIAAHALSLDLILVTANVREFSRVPELSVENWLEN